MTLLPLALLACSSPASRVGGDDPADSGTVDPDAAARAMDPAELPAGASPCRDPVLVRVEDLVDGDTAWVVPDGGGAREKVRFIGMDTPEIAHDGGSDQCYAQQAWEHSRERLGARLAWLSFDAECTDVYGRTLAYVSVGAPPDGFIDRDLLRGGYARVLSIEPDTTFADVFQADEDLAREEGRGLWSACPGG